MSRRRAQWPASPAWSPATRLWMLSILLVLAGLIWWNVREFTSIVGVGILLAYILNPLVDRLSRVRRVRRVVAAVGVYLGVVLAIGLVPLLLVPSVAGTVQSVDLTAETGRVIEDVFDVLPTEVRVLGRSLDVTSVATDLQEQIAQTTGELLGRQSLAWALGFATDFAFTVFGLGIAFIVALYVSIDTPGILAWLDRVVPPAYNDVYHALKLDIGRVWRQFFRGQLVLALVIGLMTLTGLVVLGVPYAVPLALLAGVFEVIPRLGPILATFPAMAVALVSQSSTLGGLEGVAFAVVVGVLYIVIQVLENNILHPRILGQSVQLPPAVVLIGALAGAKLAGVVGVLLAAPVLGSVRVMGSYVHHQLTRPETPTISVVEVEGTFGDADLDEPQGRSGST